MAEIDSQKKTSGIFTVPTRNHDNWFILHDFRFMESTTIAQGAN